MDYLELVLGQLLKAAGISAADFVHGLGRRKTEVQRLYERIDESRKKLRRHYQSVEICGKHRNSYSKSNHDATFMRMKRDYMGNGQLLPAYNIQMGICDGYIAVYNIFQYAADSDYFQPLMEQFHKNYGFYPKYPVADAGYGSYNNYLYCAEHGMEKHMKFTM